jgi:hypothetical protein
MRGEIQSVVELARAGSLEEAIALLEQVERRDAGVRHDLANALSVAIANLEAMADGTLVSSAERLNVVCDALKDAARLLQR